MAKTWIRAKKQFTRRVGLQTVVGHPKHPDPRGRVAEVEEGEALNNLISRGEAERITRQEYQKELDAGSLEPMQAAVDQVGGKAPRASITMSDGQLNALAAQRGIDISKAKSRSEVVKLINAKDVDVSADETRNAFSRTSGDTRDTTLHPQRTGTQADVTDQGTSDRLGFSTTGVSTPGAEGSAEGIADEGDAAPAGGGGQTGGEGSGSSDSGADSGGSGSDSA